MFSPFSSIFSVGLPFLEFFSSSKGLFVSWFTKSMNANEALLLDRPKRTGSMKSKCYDPLQKQTNREINNDTKFPVLVPAPQWITIKLLQLCLLIVFLLDEVFDLNGPRARRELCCTSIYLISVLIVSRHSFSACWYLIIHNFFILSPDSHRNATFKLLSTSCFRFQPGAQL